MVTKKIKYLSRKLLLVFTLILILFTTISCEKDNNVYIKDAIAIVYQDDVPYLINAKKETFDLSGYDEVIEIFNDYIAVKKDGHYGFINREGRLVIDTIYDRVYPMYEEKAVVIKGSSYFIINTNGDVIYKFTDGVISDSYFSNNNLVVSKNNKYGYLTYNEDNSFTLSDIAFDYARKFEGDYAVVGNKEKIENIITDENGNPTGEVEYIYHDNIKYNFVDLEHNLLFEEFEFDSADSFYDGYARVGKYATITCPVAGSSNRKHTFEGMNYQYIDPNGKYLEYNFKYNYINNFQEEQRTQTGEVNMPYATNFSNGYAVVAKYRYASDISTLTKEYMIIDKNGKLHYPEAIYYATGYLYGNDDKVPYQSITPGRYCIGNLVKIGDTLTYAKCNSTNNNAWIVNYIAYDYDLEKYLATDVTWEMFTYQENENGILEKIVPNWMKQYNDEFLGGTSSTTIVEGAAKYPYEMTDLVYSKYFSDQTPINTIRILRSNKFGLAKYSLQETPINGYQNKISIVATFVLDPIYDRIIY